MDIKDMHNDRQVIADFTNNVLRLDETGFPKQFINPFCLEYGQKFFNESDYKKAAFINGDIAGIAFLASQNIVDNQTKALLLDNYKQNILNLNNENEVKEYAKQIDVIYAIDKLVKQPDVIATVNGKPELKLLSVNPKFQGNEVGKKLISAILDEMIQHEYWLVTDTNCNWRYYEAKKYQLISEAVVTNEHNVPYKSIDGTIYKVMIYLWNKK